MQETFTAIVKDYFELNYLVSFFQRAVCFLPWKVHLHMKEIRQSPRKSQYCPVTISHAYKLINKFPQNT